MQLETAQAIEFVGEEEKVTKRKYSCQIQKPSSGVQTSIFKLDREF